MTLKDIILEYREEHNLSQREFAIKCKLSNAAISIIEKDKINPKTGKKTVPSIETCVKIANGMGITLDELLEKMDNTIPLRVSDTYHSGKLHPKAIELLDSTNADEDTPLIMEHSPQSYEAHIISNMVDKLTKSQREKLLVAFSNMFDVMFDNDSKERK